MNSPKDLFLIILYGDVYIFNLVNFIKIRDHFKSKMEQVLTEVKSNKNATLTLGRLKAKEFRVIERGIRGQ